MCYGKRSHHSKHGDKKVLSTISDKDKSFIKQSNLAKISHGTGKSVISKKQSLGMPLNNNDDQGLGGEPVGHLDASEGVGGLGGDQDGVPIGMGAGAEPLGMAKGKDMSDGATMQGLNEDSMHDNDDARPFQEQQGGDFIEGERSENMMNDRPNHFISSGPSHTGMNSFMGNGDEEHGENFMDHENDGNSYIGPKKDPLGAEIKPFNDEFKSGNRVNNMMSNNNGKNMNRMPFASQMNNTSEDRDFSNPSNGDEVVNGNIASIQGGENENMMGGFHGNNDIDTFSDKNSYKGPKKDPLGADIKPFNDEHKNDNADNEEEKEAHGDHSMNFMGHKDKDAFSKEKESNEHTGSIGSENVFSNPSPTDIGKALNGNLAALDSVNIQGDSDVAEMVRKATHQKEFTNSNKESGPFNGISLMDPGYSSTTKQFIRNESRANRRTKKGYHNTRQHTKSKVARGKSLKKKQTR